MSEESIGSAFLPLRLPLSDEEVIVFITQHSEAAFRDVADKIYQHLHFGRFQLEMRHLRQISIDAQKRGPAHHNIVELEIQLAAFMEANLFKTIDVFLELDHHKKAETELKRILQVFPGNSLAHARLGDLYAAMERFLDAECCFARSIDLAPLDLRWRFFMKRGIMYHDCKKFDLALSDFNLAHDCGPSDQLTWILTWRADVKAILFPSEPDRALEDHNRAIEVSSGQDAWPLLHRAMTYRTFGRLTEALADNDAALRIDPEDPFQLAHRGITLKEMGEYKRSLHDLYQSLSSTDNAVSSWVRMHIALTYEAHGDFLRKLEPDGFLDMKCYLKANKFAAKAIRLRPTSQMAKEIHERVSAKCWPRCFISYSTADAPAAELLFDHLLAAGVQCWLAPKKLRLGEAFPIEIEHRISSAQKVIVILSEKSIASEWVAREIILALSQEEARKELMIMPLAIDQSYLASLVDWVVILRKRKHILNIFGYVKSEHLAPYLNDVLESLRAHENI